MSFSFPSHARTGRFVGGHNQLGADGLPAGGSAAATGLSITFQDGPVERDEHGQAVEGAEVNGVFVEDVLEIVSRRIGFYQESHAVACGENALAKHHVDVAIRYLLDRRNRMRPPQDGEAMTASASLADEPAIAGLLKFFGFEHLPPKLQAVSMPFHSLAHQTVNRGGDTDQVFGALQKLLEAKDCAVRAALD